MKSLKHTLLASFIVLLPNAHAEMAEVNVAEFKPTFGDSAFGAPTSRGNDGIDGTTNTANWTHADFPTSAVPYPGEATPAPNPYWQVDLQGTFDLTRLELVDRVGCCDPQRLNSSTITLFDANGIAIGAPVAVDGLPVSNPAGTATLEFDNGGAGWTGVAAIRIDGDAANQYFQFSEFRAFSIQEVLSNVALNAPVVGSGPSYPGQGAERINDGLPNTHGHPGDGPTLGFTYSIDFGEDYPLEEVSILNRADGCCPERLSNYRVSLHLDDGAGAPGAVVWTADLRTDGSNSGIAGRDTLTPDLDPDGTMTGRHLVIENLSDDPYNPQIAEVEALTAAELPEGPENLALGATAQFFDAGGLPVPSWNTFPASLTTDGFRSTLSHPLDQATQDYYLEIDMGEPKTVATVAVTGRVDPCCVDRLQDARLELLDASFNVVFTTIMAGQITTTQEFQVPGTVSARYARIINANGAGYGPQVAEIEMFGPAASSELTVSLDSVDASTGAMSLSFNSSPGQSYAVFGSSSLEDGSWAGVIDNVQSQGETTTISFTDPFAIGVAQRFYRVEIE
ncbi:MAG: discoidin domain-containing protein [Akkermansiaceae bacterium]